MKKMLRSWWQSLLLILLSLSVLTYVRLSGFPGYSDPLLVLLPGVLYAMASCGLIGLLFRLPITLKNLLNAFLLHCAICQPLMQQPRESIVYPLAGLLLPFLFAWLCLERRGKWLLLTGAVSFIATLLIDMLGSTALALILGVEGFAVLRAPDNSIGALVCNTVPYLFSLPLMGVILLVRMLRQRTFPSAKLILRMLRPVALLLVTVCLYIIVMHRTQDLSLADALPEMFFSHSLCILMVIVSISYIVQDIRTLRLSARMETLEQQQKINRTLLTNLRSFRHNIANMLYGLEGVMLRGTPEDLRRYYDEMVDRCAMINNENIVMLENVRDSAVSALLLRHLQAANHRRCPFELYVDKAAQLNRIKSSDLCEVLGILLDNALEATLQCASPQIILHIREVSGATEIIVRNTFDLHQPPDFSASTKLGHEGLGLTSARERLAHYRHAYLNIGPIGRYVEAQVLIG